MRYRHHLTPLLVLLLLVLLVMRGLAFTDFILGRGDTFNYFYPYWTARDTLLQHGQLPLWTPDLLTGVPLLANPQLGTLYPPNWLTITLPAPDAIRISVLLHVMWAALGAYILASDTLTLSRRGALVAAAAFGLGGVVGGHVEQINQLQGLAWFPWLFWALHQSLTPGKMTRYTLMLAAMLALQVLSGHTQTVFISAVGMGVYVLATTRLQGLVTLVTAGTLALLLASPQLVPTLELISQSGRDGGLSPNAALSFSLSPFLIGRALLPSYDAKVFTEYLAAVGTSGLLLAALGAFAPADTHRPHRRAWIVVGIVGLLLALGAYNPVNWLLVRLPGFDLFRVPARWLALYALSVAMLMGIGADAMSSPRVPHRPLWIGLGAIVLLALTTWLAPREQLYINGPARPSAITWAAWSVPLIALMMLSRAPQRYRVWVAPLVLVELVAASWVMPYNDLVPPDTWTSQRLTISHMLAVNTPDDNGLLPDGQPPARLLSISGLFFDPGDKAAITRRHQSLGLSPLTDRYGFVAAKLKETFSPNLPLAWGIPTADGFGGGLLPTAHYNAFIRLAYPPQIDDVPTDGRLRENLALPDCRGACVPDRVALDRLDVGYLITDKVYDVWLDGISWDTQHPADSFHTATPFMADTLAYLYQCDDDTPDCVPVELHSDRFTPEPPLFVAVRTSDPQPVTSAHVDDLTPSGAVTLWGVSAFDSRTDTFAFLTADGWERSLSTDVKLYTRTTPRIRAALYGVDDVRIADDDTHALELLRGGVPVTLHTDALPELGTSTQHAVTFARYTPTHVELNVTSDAPALLVLHDAFYPGWQASVNGAHIPIIRANVNFRAIQLPAGESHVIFKYSPAWWPTVFIIGGIAWLITTFAFLATYRRKPA